MPYTTQTIIENNKISRKLGYDFIRFTAMMFIILDHILALWTSYHYEYPKIISDIIRRGSIRFGSLGVALFFMISGALLISKYKENFSLKDFYLKRFLRIEIPQITCFCFIVLCQYVMTPNIIHSNLFAFLISLFGLSYNSEIWVEYFNIRPVWGVGEWFTIVIIMLYLVFPILRRLFVSHLILGTIFIFTLFAINLKLEILTRGGGWFSFTNGLMCFWIGMLFEQYKQQLCTKKITSILIPIAIVYWLVNPYKIFGYPYLSCFIFSIFLLILLYQIKISNLFTQYVCKYNFEIYLIHHRIYFWFLPAMLTPASNIIQLTIATFIVIGLTLLLSKPLNQISAYILNKIDASRHINKYKKFSYSA